MMNDMNPEPEQYIDAALRLHGLSLDGTCHTEVEKQFRLLMEMMLIVDSQPVPAEVEPANIFRL